MCVGYPSNRTMLSVNAKNFTYAGTKDRQAITVQRVTAYRVTAERLAQVNRTNAPVRVGNFT
jgi:tRNA pseudouridine13 synthase